MRGIERTGATSLRLWVRLCDREGVISCANEINPDCRITVEKQSGLPFYIERSRKHKGLYVGLVLATLLVYTALGRVWDIRVEGNEMVSEADILQTLDTLGVHEGMRKRTKDLEYLYNRFLLAEERISWLAINYDGMIAHVEVDERKQSERIPDGEGCNIVAACDGVVRRVVAWDGYACVTSGETVKRGEMLISPFVPTRESGTLFRRARGSVWAETVHTYEIHIAKNGSQKSYGTEKVRTTLSVLGKRLPLSYARNPKDMLYEKEYSVNNATLFGYVVLPFDRIEEKIRAYTVESVILDKQAASVFAERELEKRIRAGRPQAQIIKTECDSEETEIEYIFTFEMTCLENIAKSVPFEME